MRNFFCADFDERSELVLLEGPEALHLVQVLRGKVGDTIRLLNGRGLVAIAHIVSMHGKKKNTTVELKVATCDVFSEPVLKPVLYVACPRTVSMEQVIRQAVELGVWRIVPIITEFTVSKPDGIREKWWIAAKEAVKQSRNPWLPEISEPQHFHGALQGAPKVGVVGAVPLNAEQARMETSRVTGELAVWVGPEGGFSETELNALLDEKGPHHYQAIVIGPYILRLETAVVSLLAFLHTQD